MRSRVNVPPTVSRIDRPTCVQRVERDVGGARDANHQRVAFGRA
jgi:hypothetical protein